MSYQEDNQIDREVKKRLPKKCSLVLTELCRFEKADEQDFRFSFECDDGIKRRRANKKFFSLFKKAGTGEISLSQSLFLAVQ